MKARTFVLVSAFALGAAAQPRKKPPPPPPAPTNLRAHVGIDHVTRLLRSGDPEERIRGVRLASSLGSVEAVSALADAIERDPSGRMKADPRALVVLARALARFADQERARTALVAIASVASAAAAPRLPTAARADDEADMLGRADLARQTAALALARYGGDRGLEALYGVARGGGSGQTAALHALAAYPPRAAGFFGTTGAAMPIAVVKALGELGDLRALDVLHGAARSSDVALRAAAIVALAELGDQRAKDLARSAIAESDVRLRAASGEAFVLLGAPERFRATAAIIEDEPTAAIGLRLAERVHSAEITKLVAARARIHPDPELRSAAVRALGRSPDREAAKALTAPELLGDGELAYEAMLALARSPAPNAGALIDAIFSTRLASLAARAYVVRALVRGERSSRADDSLVRLSKSAIPKERALGVFGRIALGDANAGDFLADPDPRVRRAAASAWLARRRHPERLLERLAKEKDAPTRELLGAALLAGDPDGLIKTSMLVDRSESAGGDAPLAAFALGRRAEPSTEGRIAPLLASHDPLLRAHVARGLSTAPLASATGRLAEAYAFEVDPEVRRAIVLGLAGRPFDAASPSFKETLAVAAELDPDARVRRLAARALAGVTDPLGEPVRTEVAWLRLKGDEAALDPVRGAVVGSEGIAFPAVFDEEGHALVVGLPPGEARLVLAPRFPKDDTARRRD
jgi:HEAT repeat protein